MKNSIDLAASLGLSNFPAHNLESNSTLLWARKILQDHIKKTYSVTDSKGIEELRSVCLGGVEQWIHIRGRNKENPVLLVLHGGPGFPMIGFMDAIQRPWEDYFTVVQWDQRQTGKSYYPSDDKNNPLSIELLIEDIKKLIDFLLNHLGKGKLFIAGHSFGSVLGMHLIKQCPDLVYAFVGIGQVVNWLENEKVLYDRLMQRAEEQGEKQVVERLRSIAPYPDPDIEKFEASFQENTYFLREELCRLSGEATMHNMPLDDMFSMLNLDKTLSPHITLTDLGNFIFGELGPLERGLNRLSREFVEINLPEQLGSSFDVPIFFFTGSHDWHTPYVLSDKWFSEISAPYKECIHFESSCHFVFNEEPGKFLISLVNKVLPFANQSDA